MKRRPFALAMVAATVAFVGLAVSPPPLDAALAPREKSVLRAYVDALAAGRFAAAFRLLSSDERRYYESADNLASVYRADDFKILSYRILGSETTAKGTVAVVSEHVSFTDHAHEATATATAKVPYAIISGPSGPVIRDPGHPWRAVAPRNFSIDTTGIRVAVRKISFFTGRVELVVAFENRSENAVTILPFGRTVLRDDAGGSYHPLATRISALTDRTLYTGLRLPSSGEYTGFLTFATPDRFKPRSLELSIAPALADGADAPFSLDFPAYLVPGV